MPVLSRMLVRVSTFSCACLFSATLCVSGRLGLPLLLGLSLFLGGTCLEWNLGTLDFGIGGLAQITFKQEVPAVSDLLFGFRGVVIACMPWRTMSKTNRPALEVLGKSSRHEAQTFCQRLLQSKSSASLLLKPEIWKLRIL